MAWPSFLFCPPVVKTVGYFELLPQLYKSKTKHGSFVCWLEPAMARDQSAAFMMTCPRVHFWVIFRQARSLGKMGPVDQISFAQPESCSLPQTLTWCVPVKKRYPSVSRRWFSGD